MAAPATATSSAETARRARGVRHERHPQLGELGKLEARRHHADHRVRNAIHAHDLADDALVGAVATCPQRVAEQHDRRGARRDRRRRRSRGRARRGCRADRTCSPRRSRRRRARRSSLPETANGRSMYAPMPANDRALACQSRNVPYDVPTLQPEQSLVALHSCRSTSRSGSVVWKRLERERVDDAEDGDVRADAEREREQRHDGERLRLAEAANRESNVAQQRIHGSSIGWTDRSGRWQASGSRPRRERPRKRAANGVWGSEGIRRGSGSAREPLPARPTSSWPRLFGATLFDDAAVEEVDRAIGVRGVARIVRHHADRGAAAMQLAEQLHHRFAVRRIEVTRRFVGEEDERDRRRRRGRRRHAAADRRRAVPDSASCGGSCPRARARRSRAACARRPTCRGT